MTRLIAIVLASVLVLAACTPGPSGHSRAGQYQISSNSTAKTQYRVLDSINACAKQQAHHPLSSMPN